MRIIAGIYKGRRLSSPNDNKIRPTTDKVKEALFSIIADNLEDAVVIDLFSGSGNLGLEAISRGASKVYFGDSSRDSLILTKKNIHYCGADDKSVILAGDFEKILAKVEEQVDLIFADPPYQQGLLPKAIQKIIELDRLAPHGLIVAEHSRDEELEDRYPHLTRIRVRRYGSTMISIYEKIEEN